MPAKRRLADFDPDLPLLALRSPAGKLQALVFGHSTRTIGALHPGMRSPGFYGMVAQELEAELGGDTAFLEGAAGSTHELEKPAQERFRLIREAVLAATAAPRCSRTWSAPKVDKCSSSARLRPSTVCGAHRQSKEPSKYCRVDFSLPRLLQAD